MSVQRLHVVPSRFAVEYVAEATFPEDDEWIALVRAPEGLTVVRDAPPWAEGEIWIGLYGDPARHGRDTTMPAAVVGPLTEAGIPVFVTSTYHADLVLVPEHRLVEAKDALEQAGHRIDG
ncbi:ACT domain-containing protein [Nocardia sp. CA2R105]|uniref:ACT domain-containing protein n=1 Tax=Nocardia coffeae TaxID=2873381 RepID=UPI001CA6A0D2|nr:ACT domain-containing protein [Nocardia coffeae]MBY8860698.1 ACT domain-containing protein [Nocardia coffeae]